VTRARDLGITIGRLPTGTHNAITDVAGVRVGHSTLIRGSGTRVRGKGPVRTGVTVVVPHDGDVWGDAIFGGVHILSGVTHPTGLETLREWGTLCGPIALTSSWSVGAVCDALVARGILGGVPGSRLWPHHAGMHDLLIVAATETTSDDDCDAFAAALAECVS
jgi:D-aminopeptidase